MAKSIRVCSIFCLLMISVAASFGADVEDSAEQAVPIEEARLGFGDATVLGLIEGITEFLPISSTGHLILANRALGLDLAEPARDQNGNIVWVVPPDPSTGSAGEAFSVKAAADVYAIVIQAGAIAAVMVLYWRSVLSIVKGVFGRDPEGLLLFRNLMIAFVPAVIVGLTLDDLIDRHLFSPTTVAAALVVGAVIMLIVTRWQSAKNRKYGVSLADPKLSDLTMGQALLIGIMQCGALWPGMSRSMLTIVGGYVAGLRPTKAAEFSFLLGLPTLGGAAVYKALGSGPLMIKAFGATPVLWGCLVAAVSAGLAVHWLVGYLTRHGLSLFAWYRVALAIGVVIFLI